jgi:Zn-dependent protease
MNWDAPWALWLPYVPAFLLAISVHESAHALAAKWLGDDTASRLGRISLYPPRHIDPFGTLVLPLISAWLLGLVFGYAKPTPVDPGKLRRPKADFSMVALAGPLSNLALALLSALAGKALLLLGVQDPLALAFCSASLTLNVILALVNLLPLPGFDGIKALYVFLPDAWCWKLSQADRYGILYLALIGALGGFGWLSLAIRWTLGLFSGLLELPA